MNSKSPQASHKPEPDDLTTYFDRSVTAVREYADCFEHQYARPALKAGSGYYASHPVLAVFLLVFIAFSIVPVAIFLISTFVTATILVLLSATCVLVTFLMVELLFVSMLLCTLLGVAVLSGFITFSSISTYLLVRLVSLWRYNGRAGVSQWADETKAKYTPKESSLPDAEEDDADNAEENVSEEGVKLSGKDVPQASS